MITINYKGNTPSVYLSPNDEFILNMSMIDAVWYVQVTPHSVQKVRQLINNQIFIADSGGFLYGELAKNMLMNWNSIKIPSELFK